MNYGDNSEKRLKVEEIQWCNHVKVEVMQIEGYGIAHIRSVGCVLVVGQGKMRVLCEGCTPDILAKIQATRLQSKDVLC